MTFKPGHPRYGVGYEPLVASGIETNGSSFSLCAVSEFFFSLLDVQERK
jgi:hypothetical protein